MSEVDRVDLNPVDGPRRERNLFAATDNIAIEAMRMNAEIARTIIDRFPQMMKAAATLLRAADCAGLPARPGMATDDDEAEANPELTPAAFDLNALVAQVVPLIVMSLGKGRR